MTLVYIIRRVRVALFAAISLCLLGFGVPSDLQENICYRKLPRMGSGSGNKPRCIRPPPLLSGKIAHITIKSLATAGRDVND